MNKEDDSKIQAEIKRLFLERMEGKQSAKSAYLRLCLEENLFVRNLENGKPVIAKMDAKTRGTYKRRLGRHIDLVISPKSVRKPYRRLR